MKLSHNLYKTIKHLWSKFQLNRFGIPTFRTLLVISELKSLHSSNVRFAHVWEESKRYKSAPQGKFFFSPIQGGNLASLGGGLPHSPRAHVWPPPTLKVIPPDVHVWAAASTTPTPNGRDNGPPGEHSSGGKGGGASRKTDY